MGRTVSVIVGVGFLVVGVLGLIAWLGSSPDESESQQFADVTEIHFDFGNSPVEFVAGEQGEVRVDYTYSTGILRSAEVAIQQDGGVLRIEQDCPWLFAFNCRANFDIAVPSDIEISGSNSNGAVVITGVEGPVDVETSNGSITLGDVASNRIAVESSNGAIRGTGIEADSLNARTSNGAIDLSFASAPENVTARSSNGAVEIIVPEDAPAYAVDADTSNGDVRTEIRTDPAASQTISVRTSNGDITVTYR